MITVIMNELTQFINQKGVETTYPIHLTVFWFFFYFLFNFYATKPVCIEINGYWRGPRFHKSKM